ncbi:MAG TPA: VWA domain-containing protein [Pyrinomonadaceae bacterium]|nr:VWA domain-containing protein [Pyrinomonadaceae bacterium]
MHPTSRENANHDSETRKHGRTTRLRTRVAFLSAAAVITLLSLYSFAPGQAGRRSDASVQGGGVLVSVVAKRDKDNGAAITSKHVALFDNGIQQDIRNFSRDPSPSRIVLLVDNSLTLRADIARLEDATREFAYEIYEGDKLLIVGYDEEAEIVSDWTDNAKAVEASLKGFRKKGQPHLFDALLAVSEALRPLSGQKRVVIVISDGLDRGSKTSFEQVLTDLQSQDITVYCVQAPDRTRGAIRRDVPKPKQVIEKLAEATGGLIFPIEEPRSAANAICDELRKSRYVLSYLPSSRPFGETRSLLVLGGEGITVRAKTSQPPN